MVNSSSTQSAVPTKTAGLGVVNGRAAVFALGVLISWLSDAITLEREKLKS